MLVCGSSPLTFKVMQGSKVSWLAGMVFYGSFLSSGTCRQEPYAIVAVKTME